MDSIRLLRDPKGFFMAVGLQGAYGADTRSEKRGGLSLVPLAFHGLGGILGEMRDSIGDFAPDIQV